MATLTDQQKKAKNDLLLLLGAMTVEADRLKVKIESGDYTVPEQTEPKGCILCSECLTLAIK